MAGSKPLTVWGGKKCLLPKCRCAGPVAPSPPPSASTRVGMRRAAPAKEASEGRRSCGLSQCKGSPGPQWQVGWGVGGRRRSRPEEGQLGPWAVLWEVKGMSRNHRGRWVFGRPWRLWSEGVPGGGGRAQRLGPL